MTNVTTSTELIPREILLGNPDKTSPGISPDGTKMAYLAPVNNVLNVWVGTVGSDDYQPVTKDEDRGARLDFWAQDNKHILYIQDVGGNENWRLYATNLENRETRDLTPFENVQAQIIKHDKHFPNELLIGLNKENPQVHDVYHLDLTSGELTLVAKNQAISWAGSLTPVSKYAVQSQHCPMAAPSYSFAKTKTPIGALWLAGMPMTASPAVLLVSPWMVSRSIYRTWNVNAGRLVKLNVATGDIAVVAEDPQYDVGDVMIYPDTHEVQAVAFDKDRKEWLVLDESIKMDFENIQSIHRGDFFVIGRDNVDATWIVAFTVDNGPVPFYAYDRKSQQAAFLFDNQPALNKYTLATIEPISFTSRDGLAVHGYLTLPPGERGPICRWYSMCMVAPGRAMPGAIVQMPNGLLTGGTLACK